MAEPSPRIATRRAPGPPVALTTALRLLGQTAPGLAARVADRMFFTPPRPRASRGDSVLRRGQRFALRVEGRGVAGWKWGKGPAVVLLHGWGGHSGQLTSFVAPLLSRGSAMFL
jgi:hypothetical protein